MYKLSGNFPINLQIALKDADFLADVAFVIEPKRFYSDRRRVVFWPRDNVDADTFSTMMRLIQDRIGFDEQQPGWISWPRTSIVHLCSLWDSTLPSLVSVAGKSISRCVDKGRTL
jgi:hypothetical protein